MNVPIEVGNFEVTSYENVIDLSCWIAEANYPMVEIAPTGGDGEVSSVFLREMEKGPCACRQQQS